MNNTNRNPVLLSVIAVLVVALLGLVAYVVLDKNSNQTSDTTNQTTGENITSSIEEDRVLKTVPTQQRDIAFELLAPKRTGDTLVFSYNLVNVSKEDGYSVEDRGVGVYTLESGKEKEYTADPIAEAYVTASDGKRYGLVADENGTKLVTPKIKTSLQPGDKTGGYFTVTLPPSGSTLTLYPGNIQAISGIKVEY